MAVNSVSLANLQRGINVVFNRLKQQGRGGRGIWLFHNDLYRKLEEHQVRRLDLKSWKFLLDSLAQWKAIRGTAGHTKESIGERGLERLPVLQKRYHELVAQEPNVFPRVENLAWGDIKPLFTIAKDIKGVDGPMFASKLCHFLLPDVFFVFDNTLVKRGWSDYRKYWEDCRSAWINCDDPEPLKELLKDNMPSHCKPCTTYPWSTKITELCQFETK